MKTVVLGPPGTGKTTTLLKEVDKYLKETDPNRIGFFSFTQKLLTKLEIEPWINLILAKTIYLILEHYTL